MNIKNRVYSAPINVFVNLTNSCNLRCTYCSAQAGLLNNHIELTTEEWLSIFKKLEAAKVFNITVTGGEPFVREDIFILLGELTKNHTVSINTNGIALTEERVKRLSQYNLTDVRLSLDSFDEEINAKLRGSGSMEKVVNAIKLLKAYDITVIVQCTLTSINSHNLACFADKLRELGVSNVSFNRVNCIGSAKNDFNSLALTVEQEKELLKTIAELMDKYPNFVSTNLVNYDSISCTTNNLLICGVGKEMCAITHDGWLIPCNNMADIRCGDLKKESITDIWKNSKELNMLRELKVKTTKDIPECKGCEKSEHCTAGCRADALNVYGDIMKPDPFCWKIR